MTPAPRASFIQMLLKLKLQLQGFSHRELNLGAYKMRYFEKSAPNRPTVVVLHGISAEAGHFEQVLSPLYDLGYNVLAPDLPGHGFTGEHPEPLTADRLFEALVEFAQHIAPERFFLVGNSLGGALSLRYAIHHPDRLLGLCALSPAGGFQTPAEWDEFKKILNLATKEDVKNFFVRLYARPPFYLPITLGLAIRAMNRRGVRQLLDSATFEAFSEGKRLSELRVPLLFVWGKSEKLFPQKNLEWFKQTLPSHVVIDEPEGVGHCPHLDSAGWLIKRLREFFVMSGGFK